MDIIKDFLLWDEASVKKGSDEIASCLKLYFEKNDIKGEKLIVIVRLTK